MYFCQGSLKFTRWFYSKRAALVLVWALLTITGNRIVYKLLEAWFSKEKNSFFTSVSVVAAAPFFGWLADAKLGNYKVVRIGITVSWLASVLVSILSLLSYNTSLGSDQNVVVRAVLLALISLFQWTGTAIIFLNSFQLSLEQMPDASAENITSLIAWFVLSNATGFWVGDIIKNLVFACVSFNHLDLYQTFTLFPVICASINFISFHLISPKWLIIEPKSPQSLKNIYRVLKFSAKYKSPLNRSALTYWEEDIPSRLDLGKSRYGGPFTTEQVEDVKTFFRILVVSVGIFLIAFALGFKMYNLFSPEIYAANFRLDLCAANSLFLFTILVYDIDSLGTRVDGLSLLQTQTPKFNKKDQHYLICCDAKKRHISNSKHPRVFQHCGEESTMDAGYQLSDVWCALSNFDHGMP